MQELLGIPIPYLVLILELFIVIVLMVGWIYGSRRMNFNLHHRAVWFVALVHFLTVGFWMIPQAIGRLSFMLANPIANWYQILHDAIGILAISLGVILVLIFLVKTGMPLKLLKRTRSLMFLTIGTWIIAFILGFYWFLLGWILA
ncbi:hypothetical protein E4H12_10320 [Candidatus Thorarchaeota archaeon]|nr:MAG: hypothetical protein E4H12_10320 [Candidatus Thorarchaeota archaeon]